MWKINGLNRATQKFFRDLVWGFVGAGLLWVVDNVGDLGIPEAYLPMASALALFAYRNWRDRAGYGGE